MTVKIKKVKNNAKIPKRATNGSAGMDLYACIDEKSQSIRVSLCLFRQV